VLLLGLSLINFACKKEKQERPREEIETLSKKEILDYFNYRNDSSQHQNYDPNFVSPDLTQISNEKILNSSQLISVIPATTIYAEHYSRILLVKVRDEIQAVVFSMYGSKSTSTNKFTGEILITDLKGNFINGFRVSEGIINTQFKKKDNRKSSFTYMSTGSKNVKNTANLMFGGGACPEHGECFGGSSCIECIQELDEVIVAPESSRNYLLPNYIELRHWSPGKDIDGGFLYFAWDYYNEGYSDGEIQPDIPLSCGPGFNLNPSTNECIPKPCLGDPVSNPEIAPQKNSKIPGGLHNTCARRDRSRTCYGKIGYRLHDGVDIKNEFGDPIYAMHDGNAIIKYEQNGAGHYVAVTSIINGEKVILTYFHLQETGLVSGTVNAGDIIGYQGDSGNLKRALIQGHAISHVHIKAKKNGIMANPLNYFQTKIDPKTGKALNHCL
jgi:murein DD-endopeptidase MepM/ murein hydrolase activator NlpD